MLTLAHRRYVNPPRVVRHYNVIINAINEKNAIKLRAIEPDEWEGRSTAKHHEEVSSARRPMAAATSAAISMKMLWKSAILYDKISPQKRLSKPNQLSYPAGIVVQKESEDLSKNPCTLHRESSISLPLSPTLQCKEKGNAQNLVKHSNQSRVLSFASLMKSLWSWNFPQQMSHFHRLYGYVIPHCPDWPAGKISAHIVISFRQSERRQGVATNKKRMKKIRNGTTVPKQTIAKLVKRPSNHWTAKWLHLRVESVRVVVSTNAP